MSRCLCKLAKGVLTPCQVKPVKDGENNPFHALHVYKTHHRPGSPQDLDKAAFDRIRRPQLPPELARTLEEGESFRQIPEEPLHELGVGRSPSAGEGLRLGIGLDRSVIPSPGFAQQIP